MPFTLSHTAAVLPFAHTLRRWRLLSAAVIGSMVPDSGIFAPYLLLSRYETHGRTALFAYCLPVGLLCYWVFQLHIKPATYELMPDRLYASWRGDAPAASPRDVRQWLLAALGILLGAFTHVAWDGFTHENARGVQMFTALDGQAFVVAGHAFTWYRLLQHVSSVVGLALVVWFVWRDVHRAKPLDQPLNRLLDARLRHRWFAAYVGAALAASAIAFTAFQVRMRVAVTFEIVIIDAAVASLWGLLFSLVFVSALVRARLAGARRIAVVQAPPL